MNSIFQFVSMDNVFGQFAAFLHLKWKATRKRKNDIISKWPFFHMNYRNCFVSFQSKKGFRFNTRQQRNWNWIKYHPSKKITVESLQIDFFCYNPSTTSLKFQCINVTWGNVLNRYSFYRIFKVFWNLRLLIYFLITILSMAWNPKFRPQFSI